VTLDLLDILPYHQVSLLGAFLLLPQDLDGPTSCDTVILPGRMYLLFLNTSFQYFVAEKQQ
jgi:hypothetical protein